MTLWVLLAIGVGLAVWARRRKVPATRRSATDAEIAESERADSVEVRVHGIGDHDEWSALGTPGLVGEQQELAPDVALPPELPSHQLRLVNWSRTSRRWAGWLWYVAFPYTLVNVAGHMLPPEEHRAVRRLQTAAVVLTSLVLTVLSFVWLTAVVETVARVSFVRFSSGDASGQVIAVLVAGGLILGMLLRWRSRPAARTAPWLLATHVLVVAGAGLITVVLRPAQILTKVSPAMSWISTYSPADGQALQTWLQMLRESPDPLSCAVAVERGLLVTRLDPLTTASLVATALALTLGALLWGVALIGRRRAMSREASTAVMTSGAVLVMAVVVLTSVASGLRLAVDWLTRYLSDHVLLPGGGPGSRAPAGSRVLLPSLLTSCQERNDSAHDLLPLLGITAALALGIGLLVSALRPSRVGLLPLGSGPRRREARARWVHDFVTRLPCILPAGLAIAGLLWLAASVLVGRFVLVSENPFWWRVAVVAVQAVGSATLLLVLAGRSLTRTRAVLGSVADVVGFWPVRWHPFGGASYRDAVVERITSEIALPRDGIVVLVGHSQGSVLAAWTIGSPEKSPIPSGRRVALVTCGSPLASLYAVFFPAAFDASFFDLTAERVDHRWDNFWRATDPIATPLPAARPRKAIPDPPADGVLRVHSDYWIAEEQRVHVEAVISGLPGPAGDVDPAERATERVQ